jgi:hypothetical protein
MKAAGRAKNSVSASPTWRARVEALEQMMRRADGG